jgi:ABC-type nitrate/sulfonate/bicarbonate transport system ATPase subunit/ABC-type nitrate/sulfonate/bicarbonate transport system permease component
LSEALATLQGVRARRGADTVTLVLPPGERLALLGVNGAGKTSLLRVLAGLDAPAQGQAWRAGAVALAPQDHGGSLLPWLTVWDNVALVLRTLDAPARDARVREALALVGLPDETYQRRPGTLSGGEQQRVALARALAWDAPLLLLDEPLSALDVPTRAALRPRLRAHLDARSRACVLVTHDPEDVLALAPRQLQLGVGSQSEPHVGSHPTSADIVSRPSVSRALRRLRVALGLGVLWALVGTTDWARVHGVASPFAVLRALVEALQGGALLGDAAATLARVVGGTAAAVVVGGSLGLWLGARRSRWREAQPVVDLLRSIPPALVYPVLLLALGYGEGSRVAAVAFGAFGVVVLPVVSALQRAPRERADIVRLAGLRGWAALRVLHLPEALPALVTATRLALAQGLVVSVVTELLVGARRGLGVRALTALQEYHPEGLWLVALVGGALGLGLNALVGALGRCLVRWDPSGEAPQEGSFLAPATHSVA